MMVEIFCLMCLFQDVRNTIQASIISGTAADKAKKTSQFYKSGLRRTQVGGATLNRVLFEGLCRALMEKTVKSFQVSSGLPDAVRDVFQTEIDWMFKRMSKNTPEKLV